jgi:hypothetical protein
VINILKKESTANFCSNLKKTPQSSMPIKYGVFIITPRQRDRQCAGSPHSNTEQMSHSKV